MKNGRRKFLAGLGGLAALEAIRGGSSKLLSRPPFSSPAPVLPAKNDFAIPQGVTYINSAFTHPMPIVAAQAVRSYVDFRSEPGVGLKQRVDIKAEFAALINAKPSEISFVPNTSAGENLVVNGLGIPRIGGNVVTDALHFEGALLHLGELQRSDSLDLRIVQQRDWRIEIRDMERAIDKKTKLVEISLVSMVNGFQHDLKLVCDLAHAHGAYVYADVMQAAGSTPIDVRESDLDFCACSSYKWLMGDFGLGFLFVKESLIDRMTSCPQFGYFEAQMLESHLLPTDPPGDTPYTWQLKTDAGGHFEVSTPAIGVMMALGQSLPYIRRIGVQNIQAHRQPLIEKLQEEMPGLGFKGLTPPESTSSLLAFEVEKSRSRSILDRLRQREVHVRVGPNYLRVSPSVFNDISDIDRLLQALG
ncbi:MAG: aminotransferase class V-fold PLP-dependent enzyme [Candidatus Acidiferrales bacterium]